MPPLRSVSSCSPSARARTVTAHSLKAIGIKVGEERVENGLLCPAQGLCATTLPATQTGKPPVQASHTMHKLEKSQNIPANRDVLRTTHNFSRRVEMRQ